MTNAIMSTMTPWDLPFGAGLTRFQNPMSRLVREARDADLRRFEMLSSDVSWQRGVLQTALPVARRLTSEARALTSEILTASARAPEVADVAFMVHHQLRASGDALAGVSTDAGDPVGAIAACDSAIRRIRKGFSAIDDAIVHSEEADPAVDIGSDLEDSLAVRRAYARAHAWFTSASLASAPLLVRITRAVPELEDLTSGPHARRVRVADRLRLIALEESLRGWLGAPVHDPVQGRRLWQELVSVVEILMNVNGRQELVEHDSRVVAVLLAGRADLASRGSLVRALEGADRDLDALLAEGADGAEIRQALERMARRLQRSAA